MAFDPSGVGLWLYGQVRRTGLLSIPPVRRAYELAYSRYKRHIEDPFDNLTRRHPELFRGGHVIDVGANIGYTAGVFAGAIDPGFAGLDLVLDARRLPFETGALRAILMFNVFHHIPDVGALLAECERVLRPGGRVLIVDEHPGVIGAPILRYLHHEPYLPDAGWTFQSTGPLSGANGALCWIVFRRDRAEFERRFPGLSIERYQPHTPLRYWLSGGLKPWTLLPRALYGAATALDRGLSAAWPDTGCFVDVELVRRS